MRLKKLGTALVVVLALGAVVASNAFAAAVGEAATWRTGSAGTVLTGSETVTTTGSGELVTTIGETPLVLKATGVECSGCKIENSEGFAIGAGKLKFTGVTVSSPATCAVSGGSITTTALDTTSYYMIGSGWYTWIHPLTGTTLATVTLTKGTGACALSGSYVIGGSVFLKMANSTGSFVVTQSSTSSGAINAEAGGSLEFGSKKAELNGTATMALSGAKAGEVFGAK